MKTDIPELRGPVPRVLQREAARWWWVPLVGGLVWFLIAWLVLRANYASLATVGVLVGIAFLVAAVNEAAIAGIVTGGWRALHVVLAVLFVLGAVWAFVRPINTFFALASVLGLLLFLQGFLYIALGAALRDESPYWWLQLTSGVLLVLLAGWMSTSDRVWTLAARSVFILLAVGFMAVFRGVSDIALAFDLHRFGSEDAGRQAEPAAAGAPRPIPAQRAPSEAAQDRQPEARSGGRG